MALSEPIEGDDQVPPAGRSQSTKEVSGKAGAIHPVLLSSLERGVRERQEETRLQQEGYGNPLLPFWTDSGELPCNSIGRHPRIQLNGHILRPFPSEEVIVEVLWCFLLFLLLPALVFRTAVLGLLACWRNSDRRETRPSFFYPRPTAIRPGGAMRWSKLVVLLIMYLVADPRDARAIDIRVEVAAGAGFAGLKVAEAIQQPAVTCDDENVCTPKDGFVDLKRNTRYVWQPVISSGVVFRFIMLDDKRGKGGDKNGNDDVMIGLGAHMAFIPSGGGTRPLPAFTVHLGTRTTQVFGGFVLGSADDIKFPNNAEKITVPSDNIPDFVAKDSGSGPNFYFGVVLGGIAVKGPPSN